MNFTLATTESSQLICGMPMGQYGGKSQKR